MAMIDAVVFDIGKVLIEWDPAGHYDRAIGREKREILFDAVDLHGMNVAVDLGADFRDSVTALAAEHPDHGADIMRWHDEWIEMASPAIDHSVRLLRALRTKGVPVFALSNFGVGTFELAATHYPFFNEFDRKYVSGYLQVMKPDPAIYEALETDSGVAPARLLFADDRPENIAEARRRGWNAHLFDGPQGWADRLVADGLLTEAEAV